jgi:hypothetical protein
MTTTGSLNLKTFRTLEFLLVVATNIAAWAAALADSIPDRWAVYATAASGALYALARGLAKQNADTKDYWKTTEFWMALVTSIPPAIAAIDGTLGTHAYASVQAAIAAALGIAMGIRKDPQVAAGNVTPLDVHGETDMFVPDENVDPAMDQDDTVHGPGVVVPDGTEITDQADVTDADAAAAEAAAEAADPDMPPA